MSQTMGRVPWSLLAATFVVLVAVTLFSDPRMLSGQLIYDDFGTVSRNPVVLGLTPWSEVWRRDFW